MSALRTLARRPRRRRRNDLLALLAGTGMMLLSAGAIGGWIGAAMWLDCHGKRADSFGYCQLWRGQ